MNHTISHPIATPTPPDSVRPARHPLAWVPTLYLAMGLPNVMVGVVAAIILSLIHI